MSRGVARRLGVVAAFLVCAGVVVAYQAGQSTAESRIGQPFVPAPGFFLKLSPTFRTTIADAYWLQLIQYYGEHVTTDQEFNQLRPLLDLVTGLSPRFERAYLFGAYALLDAGLGNEAYLLLQRGFAENPDAWRMATNAGILMYAYGPDETKREIAAMWFEKAAAVPDAPDYVSRIAARLLGEGGDTEKAVALYAELFASGDEYSREKALAGLDDLLPEGSAGRRQALEQVRDLMEPATFDELLQRLGS